MRLYDRPDPRRLDLRASLRNIQQEWLVRVNRQQASIPVHAVVDVSASMSFGSRRSKLDIAAEFIEALGQSTFKVGDALGMLAFDARERADLFLPAMVSRGMGDTMAALVRQCSGSAGDAAGCRTQSSISPDGEGWYFWSRTSIGLLGAWGPRSTRWCTLLWSRSSFGTPRKLIRRLVMAWRNFVMWNRARSAHCGCGRAFVKNGGKRRMRAVVN
jgi:hypothetical protein